MKRPIPTMFPAGGGGRSSAMLARTLPLDEPERASADVANNLVALERSESLQQSYAQTGPETGSNPATENAGAEQDDALLDLPADVTDLAQLTALADVDRRGKLRIIEALLFAAPEPLDARALQEALTEGDDIAALLAELQQTYSSRGVNLIQVAGRWAFRTAGDLSYLMQRQSESERKLSRAALETLAIIAYHQPVTRAEIEEIRGVSTSKGTLDVLLETDWVRLRGRRRAPGRPVTYGTTSGFLEHFGLVSLSDLPGLAELRGAGLLEGTLPPGFTVPDPRDLPILTQDEDPLEDDELELTGLAAEDDEAEDDDDRDEQADSDGPGDDRDDPDDGSENTSDDR